MRNALIVIQVGIVLFLARLCSSDNAASTTHTPSLRKAQAHLISNRKNQKLPSLATKSFAENNKELVEFLNMIADSRMMYFEEGKLAKAKGTTKEIKEYAELMIEDQRKMLDEIKSIAKDRYIVLDQNISNKKLEGLNIIKTLDGHAFDKKFIRLMKVNQRRDIRKLRRAAKSNDPEVKRISTKYLPLVKSHLEKLKQL